MPDQEANRIAIGNRLRIARDHAGLSQEQVAKLLNLHRPSVTESEAGRRRVAAEELVKYAETYHVDVEWLATGGQNKSADMKVELAWCALANLKKEDLDKVLNLLKMLRGKGARP